MFRRTRMKQLSVTRTMIPMLLILIGAQLACGLGSATPTSTPPTAAPAAAAQAEATSTGAATVQAQAQALLQQAVEHYQTVGREQALADFNAGTAPFVNGDSYVVCLGSDHNVTANGGFPMLVGASADSIKDAKGQPLGQAVWDAAAQQPQGTLTYHWTNPLTGQDESKLLVYQTLDQDVCGVVTISP
jgi:cytochrome c